ncbi:MAG: hypothetical protein Q8L56_09175 [Rhodocyclaceae bacterium]|nr:hypothetical protein [Rhodocyclaceae bacterium]
MKEKNLTYCGLAEDGHGITQLGRIVLDARVFGLISDTEDCAGRDLPRMQMLMQQVEERWDAYGNLPSRLPDELRARHAAIYAEATERARQQGWDPELDDHE